MRPGQDSNRTAEGVETQVIDSDSPSDDGTLEIFKKSCKIMTYGGKTFHMLRHRFPGIMLTNMIIWRGWGLVFVPISFLAGGLLGSLVASLTGQNTPGKKLSISYDAYGPMTILFAVAGGILLAAGWWLNVIRPRAQTEERLQALRADLAAKLESGNFQIAPGIAPATPQAAGAYVEEVVAKEREKTYKDLRNYHHVFFIPLQYVGILTLVGAGIYLVMTIVAMFG